jgi:hypothetical protein
LDQRTCRHPVIVVATLGLLVIVETSVRDEKGTVGAIHHADGKIGARERVTPNIQKAS